MVEQRRYLAKPQPALRGPLDQFEQRAQFLLRRHQRAERRPKAKRRARDNEARLSPMRVRPAHSDTTSPLLSSASV